MLGDILLERFARGHRVCDRLSHAAELGELAIHAARLVLTDTRFAERDQVEVGARAVRVAIGASREVGEHREGSREGKRAIR